MYINGKEVENTSAKHLRRRGTWWWVAKRWFNQDIPVGNIKEGGPTTQRMSQLVRGSYNKAKHFPDVPVPQQFKIIKHKRKDGTFAEQRILIKASSNQQT